MNLIDARQLARELMQVHGLAEWRFEFDGARRRFGSCRLGRKVITLSRTLTFLNGEEQVRDTILHEISHALTPGDGHGLRWKAKCREIGARPVRCYGEKDVATPARRAARYRVGCATCGWWADRHRLSRRKLVCRTCQTPVVFEQKIGEGWDRFAAGCTDADTPR